MRNQEQYKVGIENRLTAVETKLDEIINNHLSHLDAKVDKVIWALIGSPLLTAIATALIVKFVVK